MGKIQHAKFPAMTTPPREKKPPARKAKNDAREQRLAEALRANLRKRKQQAERRRAPDETSGDEDLP